jgi:tRNA guanosine-2'-O-methyltransferase
VTAEKWVPIIEVPVNSVKVFLEKKKREGFSILGLEQTANSIPLDQYVFPTKTVSSTNSSLPVLILKKKNKCKISGHYLSVVIFSILIVMRS